MKVYKINYFIIIQLACAFVLQQQSSAQDTKSESLYRNGWSVGFQLNDFGGDFGIGLQTVSPKIFGHTHVHLAYDYNYVPYQSANGEDWHGYQQVRLGLLNKAPIIKGKMDVYGGGGLLFGFPSSDISSTSIKFSGTGTFGLALYWFEGFTYFFEMGGTGGLGSANKLPGKPVIGSGFYTSTGFRIHFK